MQQASYRNARACFEFHFWFWRAWLHIGLHCTLDVYMIYECTHHYTILFARNSSAMYEMYLLELRHSHTWSLASTIYIYIYIYIYCIHIYCVLLSIHRLCLNAPRSGNVGHATINFIRPEDVPASAKPEVKLWYLYISLSLSRSLALSLSLSLSLSLMWHIIIFLDGMIWYDMPCHAMTCYCVIWCSINPYHIISCHDVMLYWLYCTCYSIDIYGTCSVTVLSEDTAALTLYTPNDKHRALQSCSLFECSSSASVRATEQGRQVPLQADRLHVQGRQESAP